MAARIRRIRHDEDTRLKIKTSQIINRLTEHVLGNVEMQPSQVTAALGLLKKTLPDLTSVELSGEVEQTHKVVNGEPLSESEWAKEYGGHLETPTRPPKSLN